MQSKKKRNTILVGVMVFIDIFIKIVIDNWFMEEKFLIYDNIGFLPFLNTEQLSIFNNELGWNLDLKYLCIINIIGIVVLIFGRNVLKKEKEWSSGLDIGTIMVLAGAFCSLIDKIFWKWLKKNSAMISGIPFGMIWANRHNIYCIQNRDNERGVVMRY